MGLESATYISNLVATNPTGTDKKFQGDDHIRLVKSVLQSTFPNASEAFYFPGIFFSTVDLTLDQTHNRGRVRISTISGARTVTLPVTSISAGYSVKVAKVTGDGNPVYVRASTGTIGVNAGNMAKVRVGVPFMEQEFYWDGGGWIRVEDAGIMPGFIQWTAGIIPVGFMFANGTSLLRADMPELFAVFGTTYGALDGTQFNIPNLIDRFPVGAGVSYALGATGGEVNHTLTITEMPSHTHTGTTDSQSAGTPVANANSFGGSNHGLAGNASGASIDVPINTGTVGFAAMPGHAHNLNINANGSGGAHNNLPPYFGLYPILRMC